MTVDDLEFREFFAAQYTRLCWLGLLLTGDQAGREAVAGAEGTAGQAGGQ